jgi:hypothetical protein
VRYEIVDYSKFGAVVRVRELSSAEGSLLISTLIPFEGTDGEDSTALSVGEMITKVQSLQQSINAERTSLAQKAGNEPALLPQVEHLWVVSGVSKIPLQSKFTYGVQTR